ncbi:MAG TPA: hypothetical protein VKR31_10235 [Rhizomicrobium sp.]|nr:hypothetical protein [Rhizomicrobium sp.]
MSKYLVRGASANSSMAWRLETKGEAKTAFAQAKKCGLFRYIVLSEWKDDRFQILGEFYDNIPVTQMEKSDD